MANTTTEVLTVNGVVLNTYAKNIESLTGRLSTPAKRTSNVVVPGRHGALRTTGKKFDQNIISLPMWVVGSDDDGNIPVGSDERREFFKRIDELTRLFQGDDQQLDVRHTLPDGSVRQCFADVLDVINFATDGSSRPLGRFGVNLVLPDPFWQDLNSITQSVTVGTATTATFSSFAGATAPMEDLTLRFMGPWTNPRVTFADGSWVQYSAALSATQGIDINSATWSLAGVGGLTPALSSLTYSGTSSRWVSIPPPASGQPLSVTLSGSARTTATAMTLTGRRKYLVG